VETVLIFARRHARAVYACAAALALIGGALVSRVSFDANILRLLPQRTPAVHDFQLFLQDFGSLDHLYIVFEAADAIGDHGAFVDRYIQTLQQAPEIESVDAQLFEPSKDWGYLSDRVLYLLGADGATAALTRFRSPQLEREIAHARDLLSMPSPQVKALVQQDPLGLLMMMRDRMSRQKGFVSFDPTQEGYVSKDGHSRLIVVKPKGPPFDTAFCQKLFRRLADVERDVRNEFHEPETDVAAVTIEPAGAYRVSLEAERVIRREGITSSVVSLALLLLVVIVVFRTPWIMVYGVVPLALAALLTLGVNGLMQGTLSPATSGSASMLFGLGIDGVVLMYLRYLGERRAGQSADRAIRSMSGTASSVVLAQATTAATFFALVFVDFPTLQDLGRLVGVGILLACGLTIAWLPASLPERPETHSGYGLTAGWLGRFVTRATRPIVWIGLIATVVLAAASTRLHLDTSLEKLQAQTRGAMLEKIVAERFSLPRDVLLVLDEDENIERLLDTEDRLGRAVSERAPTVLVSGIGFMLPSARVQAAVGRAILDGRLSSGDVQRQVETAAKQVGFRSDTFVPFFNRLPRLLDSEARISYDGLIAHGLGSVVSHFIIDREGRYTAVTYLYPQQGLDIDALGAIIRDVDPALRLTGIPVIDHEIGKRFFPEFVRGIAIGSVAVAILIYLVFRTIRYTLLAMLPTAIGFVWSAGILALLRIELDLFSLFAAVTFIGIGVDYSIYVLYQYLFEKESNMSEVMTRTGAAIIIACTTALIGFGTLVSSSYEPLHVFGVVSIVTLTCCLAASILLLPALIIQGDRWSQSVR
jgi:uncharacterized protein